MTLTKSFTLIKRMAIVSRWVILALDLFCTFFAMFFAILLRNNLRVELVEWNIISNTLIFTVLMNFMIFSSFRIYNSIIRFTSARDAFMIVSSVFISSFLLFIVRYLNADGLTNEAISTDVVIILYAAFSIFFLLGYRMVIKYTYWFIKSSRSVRKNVVIYGAGDAGVSTKRILENDSRNNFRIIAFIDDDRKKLNKSLDRVEIISVQQFKSLALTTSIDEVIITSLNLPTFKKNDLVDFCLDNDIKVLSVPPYAEWNDGKFSSTQLKTLKIEDLLERNLIKIENDELRGKIRGKRIVVTGAAGSIGSEICRQLIRFSPSQMILCDQAESPLHELEFELQEISKNVQIIAYLSDVTNEARIESMFSKYKPQFVFHAAAYKHVPMMEFNPHEAIRVNVIGTKILSDLSLKYLVERFVMVSTDKAVNPTNVMGASKRLAEMYVQALCKSQLYTKFITTRFGNVLGSNGSVILRFRQQIEKGGPVTVTHPNITRYFMTIPEACQLVLEAGSMGNGGEVFVFDMGEPVKISDLAKKMIRLYGMVPNIDIQITYTGLRPGEKLYEELLTDGENTIKTYHEKIMIAKVREVDAEKLTQGIVKLDNGINSSVSEEEVVSIMKSLVPEYISNNSVFEELDQAKVIAL
jgi:FlaA1/EpsC-like NDP-sugar epimerase